MTHPKSDSTARRWGTLRSSTSTPAVLRASGGWLRRQRPSAALATSPASRCATVSVVNGRLKDDFGGRQVRVRGHAKVLCHLMFGILALTVAQLVRLVA